MQKISFRKPRKGYKMSLLSHFFVYKTRTKRIKDIEKNAALSEQDDFKDSNNLIKNQSKNDIICSNNN